MNVSINPPGPQLYVEISSLAAQIASANSVEDVHICGSCKRNFSDIEQFVEHKRVGCSNTSQKALQSSVVPSHTQSSLGYVASNGSGANDDSISSLGPQYLRVIFDAANLNIDENQSVDQQISNALPCSANSEQDILRNRLLELSKQDSSVVNHHTFPTTNELHSLVLADNQPSNSKREFQIDEEDVATLLANQLASEVVSSVNETSITSKTGLINISSNIGQKSQGHYNLEPVNLPIATSESVSKDVINKRISDKKKEASKGQDAYPETQGQSKWSTGNKSKGSKSIAPVSVGSVVSSEANSATTSTKNETENHNSVNSSGLVDSSTGRRRHKCNHEACDFTTLYFKDLIRHVRKHTGERPYQCYFCHRSFSRLDKLHVHERIHTGEKKYQCTVCDYATCDSGSLRKHMRIHNNERPYKCQMCTYRSRDSSQLTVHLRTHTGDNPFVCPVADCSSAFKTSSDLKRHSRTHTGEKPFACQLCDYRCSIKTNLRIHMLHNHSESKTSSCKFCKHVCSTKRELKEHEKTHAEILKCGLCSYTCISTASMRSHHKTHSEDKYFSCKQCSFTCQVAVNLKMHVKKKHPEASRKKGKGSNKESSSDSKSNVSGRAGNKSNSHLKLFCVKSFKCTFCDAAFVREDSWRSHIRQHKNLNESLLAPSNSSSLSTATESNKKAKSSSTETTVTVEVHPVSQKETVESLKVNLPSSSEYLELNYNESTLKESESFIPEQMDKNATDNIVAPSEIDSSFVQYSVSDKNDKGELQIVHQINSEVLDRDSMSNQPILLYVQNAPVLHSGLDSNLRNAEILASINPPTPILVGRCGQYLSVPLDQGGSIVEQFTSSLPQGMQYIVSAPFEGVVESNTTYLQPLDSAETSGNPVSVVSFQVDKNSTAPTQDSEN